MKYGSSRHKQYIDESGSSLADVRKYRNHELERSFHHVKIRVKVYSAKDEMAEFIKFTDEVSSYRSRGLLTYDREDQSTRPAFIIEYPSKDVDGSYFVIKNYCFLS